MNFDNLPAVMVHSFVHRKPEKTVSWMNFDVESFLAKDRLTAEQDRYASNKFNQAASDAVPYNRSIPDSREIPYVYMGFLQKNMFLVADPYCTHLIIYLPRRL